jgi:hypothetical protein
MSAAGALPPTECWPAIELLDDEKEAEARELLQQFNRGPAEAAEGRTWKCPTCGEELEMQFTECWRCQGKTAGNESRELPDHSTLRLVFRAAVVLEIVISSIILPRAAHDTFAHVPRPIQEFMQASLQLSPQDIHRFNAILVMLSWVERIGLLFFANFARYLAVIGWTLSLFWSLMFSDYIVSSSAEHFFSSMDFMVGGAILALAFFSQLAEAFKRKPGPTLS